MDRFDKYLAAREPGGGYEEINRDWMQPSRRCLQPAANNLKNWDTTDSTNIDTNINTQVQVQIYLQQYAILSSSVCDVFAGRR